MKSLFSSLRRTVAIAVLSVGITGCGCDAWGCVDGLRLRLDAVPTGAWTVELLVNGVLQSAPANASCDGSRQCSPVVYYNILPRDNVSARVTTSAGVRTTNFPRITYIIAKTDDCHDCKGQAEVTANIP